MGSSKKVVPISKLPSGPPSSSALVSPATTASIPYGRIVRPTLFSLSHRSTSRSSNAARRAGASTLKILINVIAVLKKQKQQQQEFSL